MEKEELKYKVKEGFSYLHYATFLLMFAILPFPPGRWKTVLYSVAGVFYVIDYLLTQRYNRWELDRNKWFFAMLIVYFLCTPVWQTFSSVRSPAYWIALDKSLPCLWIGIIGLLGISRRIKAKYVAIVMLCTSVLLTALGMYVQNYLYIVVSLVFAFYLFMRLKKRYWKIVLSFVAVWLVAFLCLAAFKMYKTDKVEYRSCVPIWTDTWKVIENSPVMGYGTSLAREKLIQVVVVDESLQHSYLPMARQKYHESLYMIHPHNAFLQAWSEFGVFGLLLMIAIFGYPLAMLPRRNFKYILLIVLSFIAVCCVGEFNEPLLYGLTILTLTPQRIPPDKRGNRKV